jgi:DNA-binding NarL/FixJ family response regulator
MVTSNQTSALIIAKPGPLQIGLRALLIAMPQVEVVYVADDLPAAMQTELKPQPTLILLDGDIAGEIWVVVRRMRIRWPYARLVFLANDVQQEKKASDARADAVLLKGFPPARLVALLVRLLDQPRRDRDGDAVVVSGQPRRGWLSRLGGQLDAMWRGQGQ